MHGRTISEEEADVKTSDDYRRYETAARGMAAVAETDSERAYFEARAELHRKAAERVASGASSTVESAVWSITYQAGYVHGRSDGQHATSRDITGASDGYAAGYRRGYQWGSDHQPAPHWTDRAGTFPSMYGN